MRRCGDPCGEILLLLLNVERTVVPSTWYELLSGALVQVIYLSVIRRFTKYRGYIVRF
jgi:hypothetical protein